MSDSSVLSNPLPEDLRKEGGNTYDVLRTKPEASAPVGVLLVVGGHINQANWENPFAK